MVRTVPRDGAGGGETRAADDGHRADRQGRYRRRARTRRAIWYSFDSDRGRLQERAGGRT